MEAELRRLEEETAQRIEEAIRRNVEERLSSDEVRIEVERRIEEGRRKLLEDVQVQLQKEKDAALNEARQKEVSNLCFMTFAYVELQSCYSYEVFMWRLNCTGTSSEREGGAG